MVTFLKCNHFSYEHTNFTSVFEHGNVILKACILFHNSKAVRPFESPSVILIFKNYCKRFYCLIKKDISRFNIWKIYNKKGVDDLDSEKSRVDDG